MPKSILNERKLFAKLLILYQSTQDHFQFVGTDTPITSSASFKYSASSFADLLQIKIIFAFEI